MKTTGKQRTLKTELKRVKAERDALIKATGPVLMALFQAVGESVHRRGANDDFPVLDRVIGLLCRSHNADEISYLKELRKELRTVYDACSPCYEKMHDLYSHEGYNSITGDRDEECRAEFEAALKRTDRSK